MSLSSECFNLPEGTRLHITGRRQEMNEGQAYMKKYAFLTDDVMKCLNLDELRHCMDQSTLKQEWNNAFKIFARMSAKCTQFSILVNFVHAIPLSRRNSSTQVENISFHDLIVWRR